MQKAMKLILRKPMTGGATRVQGTRLLTPDGSEVTGIASIEMKLNVDDGLMRTHLVLNSVVVEYEDGPRPPDLREVTGICSTAKEFVLKSDDPRFL